ncbi:MAG: hypothetical protein JW839_21405 [Candidatus Lokiarchaeota archaeon]|nr:hypothetical protein [Candidatus Lokiarchaeota archaeon]
MEDLQNDNFMRVLLDVCQKTCHNGIIQHSRMVELWKRHMTAFQVEYQPIRQFKFDKEEFVTSVPARVEVLEQCEKILVDTYWAIKMVAIALFQAIPPQLPEHAPAFSSDVDIELFKLRISEKFVNSLMAFFAAERDILSPDLFVYGKISTTLRVKKVMTLEEIATMISRDGLDLTPYVIHGVMERFKALGLVEIDGDNSRLFKHAKRLELTPEQETAVQTRFFPLVEWAVETWRTVFNIRELNTPIPDTYLRKEALVNIVSYAATQGFTTAYFCIVEIKKYFQAVQSRMV